MINLRRINPLFNTPQKVVHESRTPSDETLMSEITWNTQRNPETIPQFIVYVFPKGRNFIIKTTLNRSFPVLENTQESLVMDDSLFSGISQDDESSGGDSYSSISTGNTIEIIHDTPYQEELFKGRDLSDVTNISEGEEMVSENQDVGESQYTNTNTFTINQNITVGGYVINIQDLVEDMVSRVVGNINSNEYNYAKSLMIDYLSLYKQNIPEIVDFQDNNPSDVYVIMSLYLTTVYKINLDKELDNNLTCDDMVYQAYLSFIDNIPMLIEDNAEVLTNVVIPPRYIQHGNAVERDVEWTVDKEEQIFERRYLSIKKRRIEDEEQTEEETPEKGPRTKRGGGNKFKRLTKKEYNSIKPWLDQLPITPESGELFTEFLSKTRTVLNIKAKAVAPSGNPIVIMLKNMMNIITSTYKIKPPYTPVAEGDEVSNEDEETIKNVYDCFLNNDDGDPYLSKIVADMLSIFMYLVIFCISNREPTIDNFYVEMRTVYIKSVEQPPKIIYKGVDILFEGCAIDKTQKPPLYWDNYFITNTEASTFVANFPEIGNQRLLSSPVSNKYNSPLTGGLVALLSRNLVKNKLLKLVCYDREASNAINNHADDDEMKTGSVAARTCITVDVPNMAAALTEITGLLGLSGTIYNTLHTIINSTARYEFMNLLLKYSITREMVDEQIELLTPIFGIEFIQMVKNLIRKIMMFYVDTGMCILQGIEGNEYANFIHDNTYDNPDNRSLNYRFMYNSIYTKLYSLDHIETLLLSDKEMEILLSTYIIRTPITGGSGHFQQNWTPSFNRMITDCYCKNYSDMVTDAMGNKVSSFNREHSDLINRQLQPLTDVYTATYSDKTNTYGIILDNLIPEFSTWLDLKSIDCSFDNFLSYLGNNIPNGVCNVNTIFSLRKFVLVCLTEDIYHDSKPSATRVNKDNSNAIKVFVNIALNFYMNQSSSNNDQIDIILSKAKLPNKAFTPHKGRSYEQQCYGETLSDTNYEKIMNSGMGKKDAEDIVKIPDVSGGIFKYNNAVMKQYKMENSGNSATFVDGGTLKQTENILIPNLCLCIYGNANDPDEQNDKFYIVVSYECKEITPDVKNIIMKINLIYVSGTETTMFVVHEFVLGKGVHCKEIYNDLVHSAPIKTKFNNSINPDTNNITTAFPILFCLKKTCCDLFQNILKCSAHVKGESSYEILGFFKKIPTPLLDSITNKDIATTIVMESDFKELLESRSLDEHVGIVRPTLITCKYDGDEIDVSGSMGETHDGNKYFELYNIHPNPSTISPPISSSSLSMVATSLPVSPTYIDIVDLLVKNYNNSILMSNIRWAILNNHVNSETIESLFLSCLYWQEIDVVVHSMDILPVNNTYPLLTKEYLISLFTKYTSTSISTDVVDIPSCIVELNSSSDMYSNNRFVEPYKILFWNLHLYVTASLHIGCDDLKDINSQVDYFNQYLTTNLRKLKITNEGGGVCETPVVSLFSYNNILWEFFRPLGKSSFRNINTISNYESPSLQIAITGDIMDSLFALMLVSLSPKIEYPLQDSNIQINFVNGITPVAMEAITEIGGGKSTQKTKKRRDKLHVVTKKKLKRKNSKTKKGPIRNKMKSKSYKKKR
jgi:hypothetical protein